MKKTVKLMLSAVFLSAALLLGSSAAQAAEPPPLPKVFIPAPPDVILIPGAYAYFVPDIDADIVFFDGRWYRLYDGKWHTGDGFNGPWVVIVGSVPAVLLNLPPGFRRIPPGHTRIPFGQFKKNWKRWQADRHWDKQERKTLRKERKADRKEKRMERGRRDGHEGGKGRGK